MWQIWSGVGQLRQLRRDEVIASLAICGRSATTLGLPTDGVEIAIHGEIKGGFKIWAQYHRAKIQSNQMFLQNVELLKSNLKLIKTVIKGLVRLSCGHVRLS